MLLLYAQKEKPPKVIMHLIVTYATFIRLISEADFALTKACTVKIFTAVIFLISKSVCPWQTFAAYLRVVHLKGASLG